MDHCKDIDECAKNNGGCDDLCTNKIGSFECRCETKGRKLGEDGRSCVDVDECSRYKSKVCTNGHCVNTDGSYTCTCNSGYRRTQNLSSCEEIDECLQSNGGCSQVCQNTPGSFKCICHNGFLITDGKSACRDVNECLNKKGGCEDYCINTVGSFKCACTHVGKVLSEDGFSCSDCTSRQYFNQSTSSCVHCSNNSHARDGLALSVKDCRCDKGFHGNPGLGVLCQDINECHTGKMRCSHQCVNTVGSAYCACPEGFSVETNGVMCQDMNECRMSIHNCSQICDNTPGSYRCRCFSGYRIQEDGCTCKDVDECDTYVSMCSGGCVNTEGGYSCTCEKGYQLSSNLTGCEDVNECVLEVPPCEHTCVNTQGSYTCQCDGPGFKLSRDMSSCIDVNECMEGDSPCPNNCVNTVGSYLCDCDKPGYQVSNSTSLCEDIDECCEVPSPCSYQCINAPGSFKCACPVGYNQPIEKNQTVCIKCDYGTYRSDEDTECRSCPPRTNTTDLGSPSINHCHCVQGYSEVLTGSGVCIDINECELGLLKCEQGCVNSEGSARCTCAEGYTLDTDSVSCNDINECATQNGGCEHKCINSPGLFHCECNNDKFTLADDGRSCEDVNACNHQEHDCEYKCNNAKRGTICTCPPGHELLTDGKKCSDINECMSRNGGCTDLCINQPGSFRCECNIPGYKLHKDGQQCIDINECEEFNATCEDVCVNFIGSFKCYCRKQGYGLAQDKRHCEDINECSKGRACQHRCINLLGSFRCDCDPGYYKQGHQCTPCAKGSYRSIKDSVVKCVLCPPEMTTSGKATETVHGCFCPPGYYGNPEIHDTCIDIDECQMNNTKCDHLCNNTIGSFFCSCQRGYALHADNHTCVPTQCPLVDLPKYAKFTTSKCVEMDQGQPVLPGTKCSFKCRGNMLLVGSEHRTCLANFTWTGTQPHCTGAYSCDRLPVPNNGYLYPPLCMLPIIPFRTRCQFYCDKGYKLEGRVASKCRAFNQWSGKLTSKCVLKKGKRRTSS